MGPVIADAVATATGQPDAAYLPLVFEYPAGNPTIFHVGLNSAGLLTCHEIPSLRLGVESDDVAGIVELIAGTTNTKPEAIEVVLVDD